MILVDTSVWIDFFNGRNEDPKVKILIDALKQEKDIFITDIIMTEILQGIKDDNKYAIVKNSMLTLKFVHAKNYETLPFNARIRRYDCFLMSSLIAIFTASVSSLCHTRAQFSSLLLPVLVIVRFILRFIGKLIPSEVYFCEITENYAREQYI